MAAATTLTTKDAAGAALVVSLDAGGNGYQTWSERNGTYGSRMDIRYRLDWAFAAGHPVRVKLLTTVPRINATTGVMLKPMSILVSAIAPEDASDAELLMLFNRGVNAPLDVNAANAFKTRTAMW